MGRRVRVLVFSIVISGCAMPGELYEVAPVISGRVQRGDVPVNDVQLTLHVANDMSGDLFIREEVRTSPDGRFSFESLELKVAGHEYNKDYRALLNLRVDGKERVIWRAKYSRRALAGAVVLDCDLDRPAQLGQPCWVRDAVRYPWLVAEGKQTYRRLCVRCHGTDGSGGKKKASAKNPDGPTPPDLRSIAARRDGRFDRAEIAEWIEGRSSPESHGPREMPIWGERLSREFVRYSDREALVGATIDPLVTYLESLQQAS
jgi:hypothetical protein